MRACIVLALIGVTSAAQAQNDGFEVALHGAQHALLGETLRASGTAYEVRGLSDLRPMASGQVIARLRQYDRRARTYRVLNESTLRTDRQGRFAVELPVEEQAYTQLQLQLELRKGNKSRTFEWNVRVTSPLAFNFLADRRRYEPSETVHLWARLHHIRTGAPVGGRRAHISLMGPAGEQIADEVVTVAPSGVATLDAQLPSSAIDGHYRALVRLENSVAAASASLQFEVGRRTVERVLVSTELDQRVVVPSGQVSGRVNVTTPSGTPIVGASVQLTMGSATHNLQTDDTGVAAFRFPAPAYLATDVAPQTVAVRVQHPAHGTLHSSASFLLSRVQWRVEAKADNGGLVPEIDTRAFLIVSDPRGDPAPAGTEVRVSGNAVRGGEQTLAVDANGFLVVPMRVADGAAGPIRSNDSGCSGVTATRIDAEVLGERPAFARVCVRVAPKARVQPRVDSPLVAPGGAVALEISRHPSVRGRPVLVEALRDGEAMASMFVDGNRGTLELPSELLGVIELRARPVLRHDERHPYDEHGGTYVGVGSSTAVLVRPSDAFAFEVRPDADRYRVRERARLALQTSTASPMAWAALVARDLAAHGGEQPWSVQWLGGRLKAAIAQAGADEAGLRLIQASLLDMLNPDAEIRGPQPLDNPVWRRGEGSAPARGVLRDPVSMRDELLRRGIGRAMVSLERLVAGSLTEEQRQGWIRRSGARWSFDPGAIEMLVESRRLSASSVRNLGHDLMTISMIRSADPSFSFDTVARRIARQRLVRLMVAVAAFSDPDNTNATRASAGQPPDRWLSRMVQLGALDNNALKDPWGNAFELRRTASPRIVLSDRAPDWELVSAGPDGRFGTRDDVRDPFERAVEQGTPYAVASGEDRLMKQLSVLSTGNRVLQAMAQSYNTMSLQAQEEQTRGPVSAATSESDDAIDSLMGQALGAANGVGGLGMRGSGRGGGGFGAGVMPSSPSRAQAGEAMADEPAAELEDAEEDGDGRRDERRSAQAVAPSSFEALGVAVREDFPATLYFVAEVPLDGLVTTAELPLADALTTYRVEAIAWTRSGWLTTDDAEVRVDQDATVDAPIPPFATAGDTLRIPVRVDNRTGDPLRAQVTIEAEGVEIAVPTLTPITIAPRDAAELIAEITLPDPSEGSIVIGVSSADDGRPLDAVRRPIQIWPDARLVRERRELLLEPGDEVTIEVPSDASERGPGELRLAAGAEIFADLQALPPLWGGWSLAMLGRDIPEHHKAEARMLLRIADPDEAHDVYGSPDAIAQSIATLWSDSAAPDAAMRRGLRAISGHLGQEEVAPNQIPMLAATLIGLAPAVRDPGRPGARESLEAVLEALRSRIGNGAVAANESPVIWVGAACALALTGGGSRASELMRRVERALVRVGDEAFLEPPAHYGTAGAMIWPTALYALTRIVLGEPHSAMMALRALAGRSRVVVSWGFQAQAIAAVAAGLLAPRQGEPLRVTLDGQTLTLEEAEEGGSVAVLQGSGRPGQHRLRVESGPPLALMLLTLRYGRPWTSAPRRPARIDIELEGPPGPRDTRAGLALTIRNRDARLMTAPIVEVDLPAGTELDQPTREALGEWSAFEPTLEGRTMRLRLRPLAPGAQVRLPLPLRWSLGGNLRGLGVSVFDDGHARDVAVRPTAVLPSRGTEIEDHGDEPEQAEPDDRAPESLPPDPIPIPLERLGPVASLMFSEARS